MKTAEMPKVAVGDALHAMGPMFSDDSPVTAILSTASMNSNNAVASKAPASAPTDTIRAASRRECPCMSPRNRSRPGGIPAIADIRSDPRAGTSVRR